MATEPTPGQEPRGPIPFASRAFGAVHTLLFVVDDAGEDRGRIAHAIVELFHELVPGLPVAIWWTTLDGRESELAGGDAPPLLQRPPFADPPELCLIDHGDAYDATLFGIHGARWRFVPITDRRSLYGWIGLELDEVPRESGMLPFLCTLGALVGAALTRHRLQRELLAEARAVGRLERYLSPQLAPSLRTEAFEEHCVEEAYDGPDPRFRGKTLVFNQCCPMCIRTFPELWRRHRDRIMRYHGLIVDPVTITTNQGR